MNPSGSPFASNIPKYFIYMALKGLGFGLFIAIWVIYLQERRGLSLSQAALIDVTFFVAAAFGELPTGIIADTWGRKTSLAIGSALMTIGVLGWTFAPTMPLIMVAYVAMGIGITCLSGAEDALFYESMQITGRGNEYTRLVGRAAAMFPGALAVGSVIGGLLATLDLALPYVASSLVILSMFGVVLTFKEPKIEVKTDEPPAPKSIGQVLRQSIALMRARQTLRYPIFYLAIVPIASMMIDGVFLQPQAVKLGVPLAGIGVLVMAVQLTSMAGSTWSDRMRVRFGEERIVYTTPLILISSMLLLAALQIFPALIFIALMSFTTSVLRPILLSRIQSEVPDNIRATIISMQSLLLTILTALSQPSLAYIADKSSLPHAYLTLAGCFSFLIACLLWISRHHFPQATYREDQRIIESALPEAAGGG